MHSVVETAGYLSDAKAAGMTDAERAGVVALLASDPAAADIFARASSSTPLSRLVPFSSASSSPSAPRAASRWTARSDWPVPLAVSAAVAVLWDAL